jgi:hypothetical protein
MKNIKNRRIFSRIETLYMQLITKNFDQTTIKKMLQYKDTIAKKSLSDLVVVSDDGSVNFPIVIAIPSPFFNPIVFQGREAIPMLQIFVQKISDPKIVNCLPKPEPQIINYVVRDIINCLCYKQPLTKYRNTNVSVLEQFGFFKDKQPTDKLIDALELEFAEDQISPLLIQLNL